jgi:drug/metabolite transporter (DMT)-like permease
MTNDSKGGVERDCASEPRAPRARDRAEIRAYLDVALMILIGSTTAPAAKFVVRDLPVNWVPFLRFALASVCFLPVTWARGDLRRLFRADGWRLLLAAMLCVPLNQGFFLSATRLGPTSHVALFYATCPLVVLLLAWGSRLERLDLSRLWGVLLSVTGIIVIGIGNYWEQGGGASPAAQSAVLSDLLLVGAVLSWGGYIAVSKSLIVRHGAITVLGGTFLAGCALAAPVAFFAPAGLPPLGQVSVSAWLGLAFLGLFVTPFGWAFQNLALRRFDASQVATLSNASPLLTVVWGMWLFGETLSLTLVVGAVMTLAGIYWTCRPRRPAGSSRTLRLQTCPSDGRVVTERRGWAGALAASKEIRPR